RQASTAKLNDIGIQMQTTTRAVYLDNACTSGFSRRFIIRYLSCYYVRRKTVQLQRDAVEIAKRARPGGVHHSDSSQHRQIRFYRNGNGKAERSQSSSPTGA